MTDWYSLPLFKTSWKKYGASDLRGVAVSTRTAGSNVCLKGSIVKQMLTLIKSHHGNKLKNMYMQNMDKIRVEGRAPQLWSFITNIITTTSVTLEHIDTYL